MYQINFKTMTNIIFNLVVPVVGSLLIIYRKAMAKKVLSMNEGFAVANDEARSKQTHLFSWFLFAIGTGIIHFGLLNLLGFIEIGLILFLNIVLILSGVYGILSMKNSIGFQRITSAIVSGIIFTIVVILNFSLYQSTRPVVLIINENQLQVYTLYFGIKADAKDIKKVSIIDHLPPVDSRMNGLGLGKYQRGLYRLGDNSSAHIFVETDKPKFLNIKFNHANDIYLNYNPNDPIQQQLVNMKN